jgi:Fe-S oxidoreductase
MAKMKIEVLAARVRERGLSLRDRLVAFLPRYAAAASRFAPLLNLRDRVPGLAALSEAVLGLSARRRLPRWRRDFFNPAEAVFGPENGPEVVLFADTFNRYHERENLDAALGVLVKAGYRVHLAGRTERPLCCGRTFLAAGLVSEARLEADRAMAALVPFARRGVPIVGLEPSCLLTFRDEMPALRPGPDAALLATRTFLFEEFVAREMDEGRFRVGLGPIGPKALLHGHCHQKAFDTLGATTRVLARIPGLAVEAVESSCCGMAGAFGYQRETFDMSLAMAELSLLPAIRKADGDVLVIADGTSCRQQIRDGSRRAPMPLAVVLAKSIAAAG